MDPVVRGSRSGEVKVTESSPERPYLEVRVPETLKEVHNVVIILVSHDQGFCDPTLEGRPGYTWFEAHIAKPAVRNNVPRVNIHSNIAGESAWQTNCISLNDPKTGDAVFQRKSKDSQGVSKDFLSAIEAGDILQIFPKAQFPGWANYVSFMELKIYGTTTLPQMINQTQHSSFRYHELDINRRTIRLLRLRPGSGTDTIAVDLISSDTLDDRSIRYGALSYSWGLVLTKIAIEVFQDGSMDGVDFLISASLHEALQHLRYQDKERLLWVDQLCINQAAKAETAHQVSMMGEVYSQSEKAIIWLGGGNEGVRRSLLLIKSLFSESYDISDGEMYDGVIKVLLHDVDNKPEDAGAAVYYVLHSLSQVFSLPWFWRVWVLQEAWLAPQVTFQYGNDLFEWDCLLNANHYVNHHSALPGVQLVNLPYPWIRLDELHKSATGRNGVSPPLKVGLLDLVLQGLDMKATDPRDKIFGLLGLADETRSFQLSRKNWLIYPNYEKSVSEIFTNFTRWWIEQNQSLKILSAIHGNHGRTWQSLDCTGSSKVGRHDVPPAQHPSWALWHSGQFKWGNESLGFKSPPYQASKTSRVILDPIGENDPDRWRLKLHGVKLGVILSIESIQTTTCDLSNDIVQNFCRLFDNEGRRHTWNSPLSMISEPAEDDIGEIPMMMSEIVLGTMSEVEVDDVEEDFEADLEDIEESDFSDCFCMIENGLKGLCPTGAHVGDVVVILRGGTVPFILRKTLGGSNFKFIGECFVEGKMDGSVYDLVDSVIVKEEAFTLE